MTSLDRVAWRLPWRSANMARMPWRSIALLPLLLSVSCSANAPSSAPIGDTGVACPAVSLAEGPPVIQSWASGTLPVGEGGTIVDGTYVLTEWTTFVPLGETGGRSTRQGWRLRLDGGRLADAWFQDDGFVLEGADTGTFGLSGNVITIAWCDGSQVALTYTATPTSLVLYEAPNRARLTFASER